VLLAVASPSEIESVSGASLVDIRYVLTSLMVLAGYLKTLCVIRTFRFGKKCLVSNIAF